MSDESYTHTDGNVYLAEPEEKRNSCNGCAFSYDGGKGHKRCSAIDTKADALCLNGLIFKLQTPLDAAEADLIERGTPIGEARTPDTDSVKDPSHYADSYPGDIEVYDMIRTLLTSLDLSDLNPYQIYQLGNVFKYRLRAGYKDDGGEVLGQVDLAKAMRCREMLDE